MLPDRLTSRFEQGFFNFKQIPKIPHRNFKGTDFVDFPLIFSHKAENADTFSHTSFLIDLPLWVVGGFG